MLCEVVSHGKVCDEQGKESFGDVLKFRSEQELTDEERLGCQRTSRSWVFFTCAAEGTSKSEKKVEIERRRPRLVVWIFCWAQLSVMDKQDKQQDETPCGGWNVLVSRKEIQPGCRRS